MKTQVVKETSTFYEKAFREDMARLATLAPHKKKRISEIVKSFSSLQDMVDSSNWAAFSSEIREPLDDVIAYTRPVQFVALKAVEAGAEVAVLPETPTHRQQRIVLDDNPAVLGNFAYSRALQLPRDLTGVRIEKLANIAY